MSKAMQLLGSKISLISKSEIRYEGILFTLNPNESTLALAKVRMFGTENRPAEAPVQARDEVFEFIIFRGQDIKDIRLCEPPAPQPTLPGTLPYDPAIVQHGAGSSGLQQPTGLVGGIMRPAFGPIGGLNPYPSLDGAAPGTLGQLGNFMAPGLNAGLGGLAGGLGLSGAAAVAAAASELPLSPRGDIPPHPDQLSEYEDLLSGVAARSNNSTPVGGVSTNQSRKSPVGDSHKEDNQRTSSRGSGGVGGGRSQNDQRRSGGGNGAAGRSSSRGRSRGGNGGAGGRDGGRDGVRDGGRDGGVRSNQDRNNQGSFNRFASNFSSNNRSKGQPLKFDEDYDFESANVKFEELKSKMGKMKIGGDTVLVLNGPPSDESKDKETSSSQVVTPPLGDGEAATDAIVSGAGDDLAGKDGIESPVKPICYDKTRSFFDSISCEAVERSKGNTQRTDWRQERKLNAETFGLPFNQRRGNYNRGSGGGGRGYYGGRGGGGYYRQNNDGGYSQQRDRDQRDQRDGGRDGGYQHRGNGGGNYRSGGGGGGYRGGRGGRGGYNHRDSGDGQPQPRGGSNNPRRNWQQQENRA